MPEKLTPEPIGDDEIKKVARGLAEGHIFTALHCPPDMIGHVFMVVGMGGLQNYDPAKVGMVYEWLDKAGERGINGFPMFMTCKVVNDEDWEAIHTRAVAVSDAIEQALR